MLTRIYGTAWGSKDELKAYLHMLEESVKRDHRKIGPAMGLFHFQEEAMGQAFWHQKGWQVILTLQQYIRDKLKNTYQEVNTPQLVDHSLYLKSGHWEKFSNGEIFEVHDGDKISALKPMNCPCHIQIFNQGIKSYRDLPIRMSEFGTCMRNEAHGALHGLMRVRSMTQDDGHIFCTYDQITSEVLVLCKLIEEIYADFGFGDMRVKFSDRPEMRVGHDDVWDKSEQALKDACEEAGLEWTLNPGEGAFYGPKLEFVLKDCIGRDWQCGTVQLDFNMPERLDAKYIDENGDKQVPVMIHRALLGSLERFSGILIENFVGHFPLWLAPQQMVAMGITEKQNPAVEKLVAQLQGQGFRIEGDLRNEKVSYKIREHSLSKVPVQLVLGDREIENGTVTVRRLGSQKQTTMRMEEFIAAMHDEIKGKLLPIIEDSEAA
jgi:threonyl-tRNA synthetase